MTAPMRTGVDTETVQELIDALDTLCTKYLANRGSSSQFVITRTTDNPNPWYWMRAEEAIQAGKAAIIRANITANHVRMATPDD